MKTLVRLKTLHVRTIIILGTASVVLLAGLFVAYLHWSAAIEPRKNTAYTSLVQATANEPADQMPQTQVSAIPSNDPIPSSTNTKSSKPYKPPMQFAPTQASTGILSTTQRWDPAIGACSITASLPITSSGPITVTVLFVVSPLDAVVSPIIKSAILTLGAAGEKAATADFQLTGSSLFRITVDLHTSQSGATITSTSHLTHDLSCALS